MANEKTAAEPSSSSREEAPVRQTAEQWRDARKESKTTYPGGFSASDGYVLAKTLRGWPVGALITETEYDAAVKAALNVEAR
jgi:hypothetical protein